MHTRGDARGKWSRDIFWMKANLLGKRKILIMRGAAAAAAVRVHCTAAAAAAAERVHDGNFSVTDLGHCLVYLAISNPESTFSPHVQQHV